MELTWGRETIYNIYQVVRKRKNWSRATRWSDEDTLNRIGYHVGRDLKVRNTTEPGVWHSHCCHGRSSGPGGQCLLTHPSIHPSVNQSIYTSLQLHLPPEACTPRLNLWRLILAKPRWLRVYSPFSALAFPVTKGGEWAPSQRIRGSCRLPPAQALICPLHYSICLVAMPSSTTRLSPSRSKYWKPLLMPFHPSIPPFRGSYPTYRHYEWVPGNVPCPLPLTSDIGVRSGVPLAWEGSIRGQPATYDP